MTLASQLSLMTTPLAAYFGWLGVMHGGPRPRLVSGPVDVGLLAGGLGGIVAFGPVGQAVVGRLLGGPNLVAWTIWGSMVCVGVAILLASASRRVAIYNILPDDLRRLARETFDSLQGGAIPTIDGFEDEARSHGIAIRASPLLRAGTIEARGHNPEALITSLRPRLVAELAGYRGRSSTLPTTMYILSAATLMAPFVVDAVGYWFAR